MVIFVFWWDLAGRNCIRRRVCFEQDGEMLAVISREVDADSSKACISWMFPSGCSRRMRAAKGVSAIGLSLRLGVISQP